MNKVYKNIIEEPIKQTLKYEEIFTVFDYRYLIKCKCLSNLKFIGNLLYNPFNASYYCDKTEIIYIYDNDKVKFISETIIVYEYKNPLKKGSIISLENFNENFKKNIYFKTFKRAYININKINNIKYYINYNGEVVSFNNNTINFISCTDILKSKEISFFAEFSNKNKKIYYVDNNNLCVTFYSYHELYNYEINVYNKISISRFLKEEKENIVYKQTIICDYELKILQLSEYNYVNEILYEENRDNDNKIINIKKFNPKTYKLDVELFNDNNNSLLIKSDKKFSQELLEIYNSKLQYDCIESFYIINKELKIAINTLLIDTKISNILQ